MVEARASGTRDAPCLPSPMLSWRVSSTGIGYTLGTGKMRLSIVFETIAISELIDATFP